MGYPPHPPTIPAHTPTHPNHVIQGNVFYGVKSFHPDNRTILFERGGFQHGRGGRTGAFYVENVKELLDSPSEWWLNTATMELSLWPNGTAARPPTALAAAVLETVVHINGTQASPVVNVTFAGIGFARTATAFLKPYERPISGDWAIRRSGTVLVEGATGVHFNACNFSQTGGNALTFSKHVRASSVVYGNFDAFLTPFLEPFSAPPTPHALCSMLYLVPVVIGC